MKVEQLNNVIGRDLGCNPYGEPLFKWFISRELMWPAFKTGRQIYKDVWVPIIGGGDALTHVLVDEYQQDIQCHKIDPNQWLIAKWCPAEELDDWQAKFPGAPYPARGYYIQTNASLPSCPGGSTIPDIQETERFVRLVKLQRSQSAKETCEQMIELDEKKDKSNKQEVRDEIADMVPAFAKEPGKRGNEVSVPFTKFDR